MKTYAEFQKEQYQKQLQAEAEGAREAAILASISFDKLDNRTDEEKYIAMVEAEEIRKAEEAEMQAALNDSIAHWDKNYSKVLEQAEEEAYNEVLAELEAKNVSEEEVLAKAMEQEKKRQAEEVKKNASIPIEEIALAVGAFKQKAVANFKKAALDNGFSPRYIDMTLEDVERAIRLERALKFAQGKEVSLND